MLRFLIWFSLMLAGVIGFVSFMGSPATAGVTWLIAWATTYWLIMWTTEPR